MTSEAEIAAPTRTELPPVPEADPQVDWSIYEGGTGRVRLTGHCNYSMLALQQRADGEGIVLERLDYRTQFVDVAASPPAGRARPALAGFDRLAIKADNADAATLNLPIAGTVTVDGVDHACPAGPLVFTADSPGAYTFAASIFPYLDFAATVSAS